MDGNPEDPGGRAEAGQGEGMADNHGQGGQQAQRVEVIRGPDNRSPRSPDEAPCLIIEYGSENGSPQKRLLAIHPHCPIGVPLAAIVSGV